MRNGLAFLLSGISLFGCVSNQTEDPNNIKQELIQSEVCCSDIGDFLWIPLNTEENLSFSLDDSSPVSHFPTGISYFSAFQFSERSGSVQILLRSNMLGQKVVEPKIALYDDNFALIKVIQNEDFDIKFSDAFARNRYEGVFKVDSRATPYMVLYADSSELGEKVVVPHPARVRAIESGEPAPMVADPVYSKSLVGSFELELETLTLSGVSNRARIAPSSEAVEPAKRIMKQKTFSRGSVLNETKEYYLDSISRSVKEGDIPKALSLLDEAKALNVEGAQEAFVKAVNAK